MGPIAVYPGSLVQPTGGPLVGFRFFGGPSSGPRQLSRRSEILLSPRSARRERAHRPTGSEANRASS